MLNNTQVQSLIELSQQTAKRIMAFYHGQFEINAKSDNTPVTEADIAASRLLEERLPEILNVPVLSEESSLKGCPYLDWETYWLIDPIDGTRDFINQTQDFCICIALIHKNKAIFGLINAPTTGEIWHAQYQQGVFKTFQNITEPLVGMTPNKLTITISALSMSGKMQTFLSALPDYQYYRRGSALKYIDIAEGKANLYPKLWDTSEWDTAAAQIILEEAGGAVVTFDNKAMRYGTKKSLLNPHFLAYRGLSSAHIATLLAQYDQM